MYNEENDVDLLCAASVKKLDILPMAAGIIVLNGCIAAGTRRNRAWSNLGASP